LRIAGCDPIDLTDLIDLTDPLDLLDATT